MPSRTWSLQNHYKATDLIVYNYIVWVVVLISGLATNKSAVHDDQNNNFNPTKHMWLITIIGNNSISIIRHTWNNYNNIAIVLIHITYRGIEAQGCWAIRWNMLIIKFI